LLTIGRLELSGTNSDALMLSFIILIEITKSTQHYLGLKAMSGDFVCKQGGRMKRKYGQ